MSDQENKGPGDSPAADELRQKKKERRKRVIKRIAKVVTGFVVVSVTATEVMMFIMFGRTDPVSKAPFGLLERLDSGIYSKRTLEFASGDNTLKGYVVLPKEPKALILFVHGVRASSDTLEPVIEYFLRRSYAVMAFDGTASGRSSGSKTVGLQQQRYDVRAALDYINSDQTLSSLPLVLFGHSAGAYGVAVETPASGAAACVCVSGFESPLGTMRYWAERYAGVFTNVEYPFLYLREYAAKGNDANESASKALTGCGIPTLVIHSDNDEVIPLGISIYKSVMNVGPDNVKTLMVTDEGSNGHMSILVSQRGPNVMLLDQIESFINTALSSR